LKIVGGLRANYNARSIVIRKEYVLHHLL